MDCIKQPPCSQFDLENLSLGNDNNIMFRTMKKLVKNIEIN